MRHVSLVASRRDFQTPWNSASVSVCWLYIATFTRKQFTLVRGQGGDRAPQLFSHPLPCVWIFTLFVYGVWFLFLSARLKTNIATLAVLLTPPPDCWWNSPFPFVCVPNGMSTLLPVSVTIIHNGIMAAIRLLLDRSFPMWSVTVCSLNTSSQVSCAKKSVDSIPARFSHHVDQRVQNTPAPHRGGVQDRPALHDSCKWHLCKFPSKLITEIWNFFNTL